MHPPRPTALPRSTRSVPILLVALVSVGCGAPDAPESGDAMDAPEPDAEPMALQELVAAERAFSAHSADEGMQAAFLTYFAPDVVTFSPEPTVGTEALEAGPPGPHLVWWPEIAEVSAAGDMGYTSGPYRVPRDEGEDGWGHYHSVWGRTADGGWHVLLDVGGPHGPVDVPTSVERPDAPATSGPDADGAATAEELLEADRAFLDDYRADPAAALRRHALARARFYRFGQVPLRGVDAALADREVNEEHLTWEPEAGGVASSGDLGYTYGTGTAARAETGGETRTMSYARVWRRVDASWKVVLEVVLPYPAGGAGE